MVKPLEALDAARNYIRSNPSEVGRAVRSAMGLRVGVPLVGLRWMARQLEREGKVKDMKIDSVPPGIKVASSLDAMGTPIRAGAVVYIERITFNDEELTVSLRVEDVSLKMDGEAESPVAMLIKSGALDLSNPGNLVAYLPQRPPIIAEAKDNRIVLDLMRNPKIGRNPMVRHAIGALTSLVTLQAVESDPNHLDIAFRALPTGVFGAARAVRRHLVRPTFGRFLSS